MAMENERAGKTNIGATAREVQASRSPSFWVLKGHFGGF